MADSITDTGWKPVIVEAGDDAQAQGHVEMVTGQEKRPCFTCRAWEKDLAKITRYFIAKGLEARPDGCFLTPIVKDFGDGRQSMVLDPKVMGWCRRDCIATDMQSTCENWEAVKLASELQSRITG